MLFKFHNSSYPFFTDKFIKFRPIYCQTFILCIDIRFLCGKKGLRSPSGHAKLPLSTSISTIEPHEVMNDPLPSFTIPVSPRALRGKIVSNLRNSAQSYNAYFQLLTTHPRSGHFYTYPTN